jgi:predicted alpha/beta-hydrolase family hydrolase
VAAPASTAEVVEIETPHGLARAHLHRCEEPRAALVLGHGAGGGIGSPDLVAACGAALAAGVSVALVEQPYRVAGRRSPAPARQLDAAWIAVVEQLSAAETGGLALIVGGRSSGARVACRTAATTEAAGVLCLAFPLVPPGRSGGSGRPGSRGAAVAQSRLPELEAVSVPMLIVQGEGDPFGMPPAAPRRVVVPVRGNHSLRSDQGAVGAAVGEWLANVVRGA